MRCPFHTKLPGEAKGCGGCPFLRRDKTSEECLLANSIVAIPAKLDHLYNVLDELAESIVTINGNIADMLVRLETRYSESETEDDTENGRTGEAVEQGTPPEKQEGGNDGKRQGAVHQGVRGKGKAKSRAKKGAAGRDGEEEPAAGKVVKQ